MLTKNDLSQIRKIIREEIEAETQSLKDELSGEIKLARIQLQKEVSEVKNDVKNLKIENSHLHLSPQT